MPRVDRVSLNADGLDMPAVDHLSNKSSHNVLLDRAVSGWPAGIPQDRTAVGLLTNFCRLTDKALREYDAARAELMRYVTRRTGSLGTDAYLRAVDHMENCLSATHRAVLNATALRTLKVGRSAPRLTVRQEKRLKSVRNAIEHADEKIIGQQMYTKSPAFAPGEPYALRLANTGMVIGGLALSYKEIVSAMSKMYRTIEAIRQISTGDPGPTWPNAVLRTDPGRGPNQSNVVFSEYLQVLSRLTVTH